MNDAQMMWYWIALGIAAVGAWVNSRLDMWLYSLRPPFPLRARLAVSLRWGFICAILLFAFLIDSHRVPYSEMGLWLLLCGGALLVVVLRLVTWREKE
jgi:hypothetical protein